MVVMSPGDGIESCSAGRISRRSQKVIAVQHALAFYLLSEMWL